MAEATPPRKKNLPFKATALRRSQAAKPKVRAESGDNESQDASYDLFSRRREMAATIEAERERKWKKSQLRSQRRRSSGGRERSSDGGGGGSEGSTQVSPRKSPAKTRETPTPAQDNSSHRSGSPDSPDVRPRSSRKLSSGDFATPPPSKRSRTDTSRSRRIPRPDDSQTGNEGPLIEDSPSNRVSGSRGKHAPSSESPGKTALSPMEGPEGSFDQPGTVLLDSDSDQHTPQRDRSSSLEILGIKAKTSPSPEPQPEEEVFGNEYVVRARAERLALSTQNSSLHEDDLKYVVEVLVTSTLDPSKNLKAKVRLDQQISVLANRWVSIQRGGNGADLSEEDAAHIILTWERKRVYNSTSLYYQGIRPAGEGRVTVADGHRSSGLGPGGRGVLLEAWTPAGFAAMEKEEALRRRHEYGDSSDEEEAEEEEPAPEIKLKVRLVAKGKAEVGLTVRPETTVETLITGFRKQSGLPPGTEIILHSDGERLEEHTTMAEAGIDDLDQIEVYLK